jgi:hypothetical protein
LDSNQLQQGYHSYKNEAPHKHISNSILPCKNADEHYHHTELKRRELYFIICVFRDVFSLLAMAEFMALQNTNNIPVQTYNITL